MEEPPRCDPKGFHFPGPLEGGREGEGLPFRESDALPLAPVGAFGRPPRPLRHGARSCATVAHRSIQVGGLPTVHMRRPHARDDGVRQHSRAPVRWPGDRFGHGGSQATPEAAPKTAVISPRPDPRDTHGARGEPRRFARWLHPDGNRPRALLGRGLRLGPRPRPPGEADSRSCLCAKLLRVHHRQEVDLGTVYRAGSWQRLGAGRPEVRGGEGSFTHGGADNGQSDDDGSGGQPHLRFQRTGSAPQVRAQRTRLLAHLVRGERRGHVRWTTGSRGFETHTQMTHPMAGRSREGRAWAA